MNWKEIGENRVPPFERHTCHIQHCRIEIATGDAGGDCTMVVTTVAAVQGSEEGNGVGNGGCGESSRGRSCRCS